MISALVGFLMSVGFVGLLLALLNADFWLDNATSDATAIATAVRPLVQERKASDLSREFSLIVNAVSDERAQQQPSSYALAVTDERTMEASGALLDAGSNILASTFGNTGWIVRAAPFIAEATAPGAQAAARWTGPGRRILATAPVYSDDGRLLGSVVLQRVGLPPWQIVLGSLPSFFFGLVLPWLMLSTTAGFLYAFTSGRELSRRLNRLTDATAAVEAGDFSERVAIPGNDDIGRLEQQFNEMAARLEQQLHDLEALAARNALLATRAGQAATAEERNRMARELHDSVSQELFSLTMLASATRREIERGTTQQHLLDRLDEIHGAARRALQETRSIIFALRPATLNGREIEAALHDLATALRERQGFTVLLSISGETNLPLDLEQALFRIAQEALANAARHADIDQAALALRVEPHEVRLIVSDQGCGFDAQHATATLSLGLVSMRERASALGGTFQIESARGCGTTITAVLPLPVPNGAETPAT